MVHYLLCIMKKYNMINFVFALVIIFTSLSCKHVDTSTVTSANLYQEIAIVDSAEWSGDHIEASEYARDTSIEAIATSEPENVKDRKITKKHTGSPGTIEVAVPKKQLESTKVTIKTIPEKEPIQSEETPIVPLVEEGLISLKEQVPNEGINKPEEILVIKPDHTVFDKILKQYVSASGKVDYKGIKADIARLDSYLGTLESTKMDDSWSRKEKLAFWINAYNAYTIKLIVQNYPLKSIMDLHGGKPWDQKWINIAGQNLSLNNIENDIIRPQFNEPRIHFAVNCAAASCPPILNKAYTAGNLEATLTTQTQKFLANAAYNKITPEKVEVSKIFEWYAADFGDLITFVNKYSDIKIKSSATVSYRDYDWSLNE